MGVIAGIQFPFMVLLVLNPQNVAASNMSVVSESLQDGFGYYYMIHGFALGIAQDYVLQKAASYCACRRRCQVTPWCHSVSAIRGAEGGTTEVECRVSTKPVILNDTQDRPRLYPTEGAVHFLQMASAPNASSLIIDGIHYYPTEKQQKWEQAPDTCTMAVLRSRAGVLKLLSSLTANTRYHVNLSRKDGSPATWDYDGQDPILYTDTDLGATNLIDDLVGQDKASFLHLIHDGLGSYTFIGAKDPKNPTLCQENPLNLEGF